MSMDEWRILLPDLSAEGTDLLSLQPRDTAAWRDAYILYIHTHTHIYIYNTYTHIGPGQNESLVGKLWKHL